VAVVFGQYARTAWRLSPRWHLVARVDTLAGLPVRGGEDISFGLLLSVASG